MLAQSFSNEKWLTEGRSLKPKPFHHCYKLDDGGDESNVIRSALFADDLVILVCCHSYKLDESMLQEITQKFVEWSTNMGLSFLPPKTKAVHICRIRHCQQQMSILLESENFSSRNA